MLMLDEKIVSLVEIKTKSKDDLLKLIQDMKQSGTQRHLVICEVSFVEALVEELYNHRTHTAFSSSI